MPGPKKNVPTVPYGPDGASYRNVGLLGNWCLTLQKAQSQPRNRYGEGCTEAQVPIVTLAP
jgi:hypothetical protein